MNKLIIIVALTVLLRPVFPILDYIANYDYIVKELCINRDNARLNCKGHCHLKKQLAKASGDTKSGIPEKEVQSTTFDTAIINDPNTFHLFAPSPRISNTRDFYCRLYHYDSSCTIFHPPLLY